MWSILYKTKFVISLWEDSKGCVIEQYQIQKKITNSFSIYVKDFLS
jgi:hypothetical protein